MIKFEEAVLASSKIKPVTMNKEELKLYKKMDKYVTKCINKAIKKGFRYVVISRYGAESACVSIWEYEYYEHLLAKMLSNYKKELMKDRINIPIIKEDKDMSWFNSSEAQESVESDVKKVYGIEVCDEYNANSEDVSLTVGGRNELYRTLLAIESNGITKGYRKIGAENIFNTMIRNRSCAVKIVFSPEDDIEFCLRHKDLNEELNYLHHSPENGYYFTKKGHCFYLAKFKEAGTYKIPKSILENCEREYVVTEEIK